MLLSIHKEAPALIIDVAIGIVGFVFSLGRGKASGRSMDGDTTICLAKVWAGIAILGMALAFVV
ncbi:hypothetical protein [Acidipila sp. EB88]|uniref:hypothetical protein n=1 Tax=Acidipila sp. EB88 TaxID=2305226 RepID=UPI000F5FF032|nr:hypothetical protein [Acidipila sp. EB88]